MSADDLKQLGLKIKTAREAKKFSLADVAAKTKINVLFLTKFEQGQFDFLPEFYVRNFLKIYLQQLGVGAQKLLDEYDQILNSAADAIVVNPEKTEPEATRFQFLSNLFRAKNINLSQNS